ncbi:MAG: metallophosphoesterase [Oscillatoriales cyanobacterium SM2_2_1]|nr:metallophosphoesterase [Oscillatoriales cyanobacterium SM2_2_1]
MRLAVISDLNSQYGSTTYETEVLRTVEYLPQWEPDLVLCSGDMVAGQFPSLTRAEIEAMWAAFDRNIAQAIRKAKLPYGFTIGNHDASGALGLGGKELFAQERELARAYWNTHADTGVNFVDQAGFPYFYTFAQKFAQGQDEVFFLVWDASTSRIPPEQLDWAEKALASDRAQGAKLRIVTGHLPLYAVAVGREYLGEIVENGDRVRQMLEKYRVHTYISGHHHAYYPAHKGTLQLLHSGALGSGARPLLDSRLPVTKTLTLIDISLAKADTVYTTYNMTTQEVIDMKTLPRQIVGPNGYVLRRDINESDLTPAEKSAEFSG